MQYDLKGKIALVTGGAQGIGFSCVKELLRNEVQGVGIVDIDDEKGQTAVESLSQEFGVGKVIFIKTDITKADQLEAAFKKIIDTWKTLDVVINNAGVLNEISWELAVAVNCNATVHGTLLGLQYMGKDKGGKGGVIVNTSSNFGLEPSDCCPIYVGTKHFIVGFSRSLGTPYHFDRTGVKVLTMCPNKTITNMSLNAVNSISTALGPDIQEHAIEVFSEYPPQTPEKVARAMVTIIKEADNGSVWVCEGDDPVYKVDIPDRSTIRKF